MGAKRLDAHGLLERVLASHIAHRIASACATALTFSQRPMPLVPTVGLQSSTASGLLGGSHFGSTIMSRHAPHLYSNQTHTGQDSCGIPCSTLHLDA